MAKMDGGAHEGEAFVGDTIATGALDLANQAMRAQELSIAARQWAKIAAWGAAHR